MKKCLVLLICLLLLGSTCYASVNFNVEDYTDDELIEIVKAISEADAQLGYLYSNDILVVGEDIPAGAYEFWVEEEDVGFVNTDNLDYHCVATMLCNVKWGSEYNVWEYDGSVDIYYDEYGAHKLATLEEGQYLWTTEISGNGYLGLRMKYIPERKSGLFSN